MGAHNLKLQVPWFSWNSQILEAERIHKLPYNVAGCNIKPGNPRLVHYHRGSAQKNWMSNVLWRTYTVPVSLEESSSTQPEDYSLDEENASEDSPEEPLDRPLSGDEEQTKDVDTAPSKEVSLYVLSVQEMGTFDGWSQGENLSPEYDGSFTKFATT
ncbi:hypothetical protein Peur_053025 [Populus x canadensis]